MMRLSVLVLVLAVAACGAGKFDRERCERIVAQVRARNIAPGHSTWFRVSDDLDATTLAAMPEQAHGRGDGRGIVRAYLSADRKLAVSIETRDEGHAGEYGFLYTDPGMAGADLEGTRLDSQSEERIDDRWVRWTFNGD